MSDFPENLLPSEYLLSIAEGKSVFVVGEDFSKPELKREAILANLADQLGIKGKLPFPLVAQTYETRYGRAKLLQEIQSHLSAKSPSSTINRYLASLPSAFVLYCGYDSELLDTYQQLRRPIASYFGPEEVRSLEPEARTHLIYLFGSIHKEDSLILTEDDYEEVFYSLPKLSEALSSGLASRPIIYIGFEPDDWVFARIHHSISLQVDRHKRPSVFVYPSFSQFSIERLSFLGLEPLNVDAASFLEYLDKYLADANALPMRQRADSSLPQIPYKFLDYFTIDDTAIFYGRDTESFSAAQMLLAYKLVVLFGPSGVGKTSLIQAGLQPILQDEGYQVVYVRTFDDPIDRIKRILMPDTEILVRLQDLDLRSFIEAVSPRQTRLVIVLDQFEEFFIQIGRFVRLEFAEQIANCRHSPIDIRFLFSFRSDYLDRLEELTVFLPDVYEHRMSVGRLDQIRAEQAIVRPAELFGFGYDRKLLDTLLTDLSTGQYDPPQLQIACYELFRNLPQGKSIFELDEYRQLGGLEGILASYLDRVLDEIASELALPSVTYLQAILTSMVTSEQTKRAVNLDDMARDRRVANVTEDKQLLLGVVEKFIQHRVIRLLPNDVQSYELAHDYLVPKIWTWLDEKEAVIKYLQTMLQQELSNWRRLHLLMDKDKLLALDPYRDLLPLSKEEIRLIFQSALRHDISVSYWFTIAKSNDIHFQDTLTQSIRSEDHNVRSRAITSIIGLNDPELIPVLVHALQDEYPQVRSAAIRALEAFATPDAIDVLHENLSHELFIPSGVFVMGNNNGEPNEFPEHQVFLDGYYIDKYPVTNSDYLRFLNDHPDRSHPPHWPDRRIPTGQERHPAIFVSWIDAITYAMWAGKRLPTEAEWERAATWDDKTKKKYLFPWGNEVDLGRCNTAESSFTGTTEVDRFEPRGCSPCGAVDMAGNVQEWVSDWYEKEYYQKSPNLNPVGPIEGKYKVVRGGSWNYTIEHARGTSRATYVYPQDVRFANVGFRLVLSSSLSPNQTDETDSV